MLGTSFAGYAVHERINRGGMADIYLVTDPDGRNFILRVLLAEFRYNWQATRRFRAGCQVERRLDHPTSSTASTTENSTAAATPSSNTWTDRISKNASCAATRSSFPTGAGAPRILSPRERTGSPSPPTTTSGSPG